MKFTSAKFYRAIYQEDDLPPELLPQFIFIGRSNVGKSSLINALTGDEKLSRTGKTPGVTKRVNLFLINQKFYLADLPGYGYAQASKKERKDLQDLIFWYLETSPELNTKIIFLIIDARLGPTAPDLEVIKFFQKLKITPHLLLSKVDQVKTNELKKLEQSLHQLFPSANITPFSSHDGSGIKQIRHLILQNCQ